MAFVYEDASVAGKTSANADVFAGQFVELVPGERIVERVEFQSDDPAFAGAMRITTTFTETAEGTGSISSAERARGISAADHQVGMASTLANLAAFVE